MKKIRKLICFILVIGLLMGQPIPVAAVTTIGGTQISYDEISIANNAGTNDYIYFKNIKYVLAEDKSASCVVSLYKDEAKSTKLSTKTISYSYLSGKDYTWNVGNIFGREAGSVFLTFKYSGKEESETVKISYEAERTSPNVDQENVIIENKYNGTAEKIYVTVSGLSYGDYVYIYKKAANGAFSLLGSLSSGNAGVVTGNYTRTAGLDQIYISQKKKNEYESEEKLLVPVPEAGITTFGENDTDYPDVKVVAKDRTGNDIVEITGVGTKTVVTVYADPNKNKIIKTQTINGNGNISISNIMNYEKVYVTFRAPDKYESSVLAVPPVPAEKTLLAYDKIEIQNNADANDYIKFSNLKYTDEADKGTGVTYTLYADKEKSSKLFSGTMSYSLLQGGKEYSSSIGKKFGADSGEVYLSFKYAFKKESDLIPLSYEAEKYSPDITKENVTVVNKYTGTKERIYVTVDMLQSGDIVYVYKLLSNGSYSQLASMKCSNSSGSVTMYFDNPSDADCIYLQMKRENQYISPQKIKFVIPDAGITSYGGENTDLPSLSISALDKMGNDLVEISGAAENTNVVIYSDAEKVNKIASATINVSGNIAIKNIMNYEALYITVRVPDKYESGLIRVVPIIAPKSAISYEKIYVNNFISEIGDSICFDGLKYADDADKNTNLTLKIYTDQDKETVLYTGTISYSKLQGGDYSISLDNKLGLESGILYVTVKYPTKRESELIPISYEGERTSSKLSTDQIIIDNDLVWGNLLQSNIMVKVPDKSSEEVIRVYRTSDSAEVLAKDLQSFELPSTVKSVFVTIQKKGYHESERLEVALPKARSCSTSNGTVKIENNAGIYADCVSYSESSEIPDGTVFTVYKCNIAEDGSREYVKIGSTVVSDNQAKVTFDDNSTLGEEEGSIFTTLTYPGYEESLFIGNKYEAELLSMRVGVIRSDKTNPNKIIIENTRQGDIIRVYADQDKNNLLVQTTASQNSTEIDIPSISEGTTVFITNQTAGRGESKALPYTTGLATELGKIVMDGSFTSRTYSLGADFSDKEQIMIGLIRPSGKSSILMDVYDGKGSKVAEEALWANNRGSGMAYKRWVTLDRPEGIMGKYTYNVVITQEKYVDDTAFKLVSGDSSKVRELFGGRENAVEIEPYQDPYNAATTGKGGNIVDGEYVPGNQGSGYFYHFTYRKETDTVTLYTSKADLRFCIYEGNTEEPKYNSNDDQNARRTECKVGFSCVEKARQKLAEKLQVGQDYYLEVYSVDEKNDPVQDYYTYYLAVGDPVLQGGFATVSAKASLSVPANGLSSSYFWNIIDADIPDTALVQAITPKDNSGKRPSELVGIDKFRLRNTSEGSIDWHTCSGMYQSCEFRVQPNSILGTHVKGRWEIQVSSQKEAITIIPKLDIRYYYEIGD